jgi:hypothetical protein
MSGIITIRDDQLASVARRVAALDEDLNVHPPISIAQLGRRELADSIVTAASDGHSPKVIFNRLRWGGQVVFVAADQHEAVKQSIGLEEYGFEITQPVKRLVRRRFGLPLPFLKQCLWYFVARKVLLVPPGQLTDRFTYHVHLQRAGENGGYVVSKEVPTIEQIKARLHSKWPELSDEIIEKRARKFADKIFPIFLTREAAILKIVNRDLPEGYRDRVPKLLDMEQDSRGLARTLKLQWLRNGGKPLSHLEFARQSADLLRVLHDGVGVIHLDLRLDNFVITPKGVGFVDFGSAARVDEDMTRSPMLAGLFEELMRTSEIQRMLAKMTRSGQVTSDAIRCGLHKVDKAVDFFYLAVQISSPHSNPDLKELIQYDKKSAEAGLLKELTQTVLRPPDPSRPQFGSAASILRGIEEIGQRLADQSSGQESLRA